MDGILSIWDLVIDVFHSSANQTNKTKDDERQKLVGKNTTKYAETDSNHAHQSRSDHSSFHQA